MAPLVGKTGKYDGSRYVADYLAGGDRGKQCALLVPTTILAMQHYNTVLRRFGDMPLTVKLLNRFVSKREQEKTIAGLKSGRVDMVVGTHRLISKDVEFKNIGLVIIDE